MRQTPELPRILSGRGQLFQADCPPIDVRYQIVLAGVPAVPPALTAHAVSAAARPVPAAATQVSAQSVHANGHLVVLSRADTWRIDSTADYQLALSNGRRCRVTLLHDPRQPFTKYRILVPSENMR